MAPSNMKTCKLLIDTNIILDVMLQREPFYESSKIILDMCHDNKAEGYISFHSIPTLWYFMRKAGTDQMCRKLIYSLLEYFEIPLIDKDQLKNALARTDSPDFEDCLQDESAIQINADFIITRNKKNFAASKVPAFLPEEFLEKNN